MTTFPGSAGSLNISSTFDAPVCPGSTPSTMTAVDAEFRTRNWQDVPVVGRVVPAQRRRIVGKPNDDDVAVPLTLHGALASTMHDEFTVERC